MNNYFCFCVLLIMAGNNWAAEITSETNVSVTTGTSTPACDKGTDEYCARCNSGTCTRCYASYVSGKSCVAIESPIAYCAIHESATKCLLCVGGYYLKASACASISIENCNSMNESKCSQCTNGQVAEDGTCPGTTACTIEKCKGCKKEGETELCTYCEDGYAPSEDQKTCMKKNTSIEGCQEYASDKCQECMFGYYISTFNSSADVLCKKSTRYESVEIAMWGITTLLSYLMWFN